MPRAPVEEPGGVDVAEAARVDLVCRRLHHDDDSAMRTSSLARAAAERGRRRQLLAGEEQASGEDGAPRRAAQLDHHRQRALHVAGAEAVPRARRRGAPGGCPARAPCRDARPAAPRQPRAEPERARMQVSPRVEPPPGRRLAGRPRRGPRAPASSRDSEGTSIELERPGGEALTQLAVVRRTATARPPTLQWVGNCRKNTKRPHGADPRRLGPAETGRAKQRAYASRRCRTATTSSGFSELLRTAGVAVVGELVQHREQPHPNLYLGPGKVEELKELIKRADANVVVADDELTPAPGAQPRGGARRARASTARP